MAARLSLTLTESDVNVANNTSKVTAKLYYYGNGVSYNNNNPSGTIKIDGTSYSFNHDFKTSTSAQLLATKSKTVTHNADGSKKVTVEATFKTGVSLGTLSTSKSITLTTIPRASQPSVNKVSIVVDGNDEARTVTISTNRASTSFTHTIECKLGNTVIHTITGVQASANWIIPMSVLNNMTTVTESAVTVTCKTYNGSTLIGIKTTTLKLVAPNTAPTIGTVTFAQATTLPSGVTGYVQGKSKLSVSIPVTPFYGSPISKIDVIVGGITYSFNSPTASSTYTVVTDYLTMSGANLPVTVRVTDARGNMAEKPANSTVTIQAYAPPTVANASYQHNSDTVTKLEVSGNVASITGQSATLYVKYKKITETSFPSANIKTVSVSGNFAKPIEVTIPDTNIAYDYEIYVTDKFGTGNTYLLKTGIVVLSRKAGGTGVTLFEEATEDGFVVGGGKDSRFTGDITLPNIYVNSMAGQVYFNKNDTKLYGKYTDGTSREIMTTCYTDDAFSVGYGGYKDSVGKTSLYGNDIQLRCNNNLAFYVGANSMKPYFAPGDTYDAYWYGAGFLTDSKTKVYFTLPLAKPMLGVSAVTVSSGTDGGFILRQNDKYTHGSASNARKKPSSYAVTARYMYVGFGICAEFATTTNAVNNSAIGINWRGTITFS